MVEHLRRAIRASRVLTEYLLAMQALFWPEKWEKTNNAATCPIYSPYQ